MLFDPSNSEVFWLNVTNVALGVICLVCILALGWGVARDLAARWRHAPVRRSAETHVFDDALLGMTMADGGQPRRRKVDRNASARN